MSELKPGQNFISAEELKSRLGEPKFRILYVQLSPVAAVPSSGPFSTGDGGAQASWPEVIPGSQVFDLEHMSDESSSLPHMALPKDDFARKMRALGIDSEDEIIVYDEQGVYSAPRARALFLNSGHERVRILEGGLPAWKQRGYPILQGPGPDWGTGNFSPRESRFKFVDQTTVLKSIGSPGTLILDARSEVRFKGLVEEPRVGLARGHIPSAISMPYTEVVEGALLKPFGELKRLFQQKGAYDHEVIVYCGSGVTACIVALALEVAGHPQVSVYDGSWSEWGRDRLKTD
jgi:thiosulfate/3-mercaptopyruvate sulfurtransferase